MCCHLASTKYSTSLWIVDYLASIKLLVDVKALTLFAQLINCYNLIYVLKLFRFSFSHLFF